MIVFFDLATVSMQTCWERSTLCRNTTQKIKTINLQIFSNVYALTILAIVFFANHQHKKYHKSTVIQILGKSSISHVVLNIMVLPLQHLNPLVSDMFLYYRFSSLPSCLHSYYFFLCIETHLYFLLTCVVFSWSDSFYFLDDNLFIL